MSSAEAAPGSGHANGHGHSESADFMAAATAMEARSADMEAHKADVARISERVLEFHARQQPFRVYHGSTNSTRASARSRDNTVDTSGLNRVLRVDPVRRTALVEPNVGMGPLLAATTAHNLVPLVVMEFPNITVGGGFSGMAGESSCFRHGPFDATVNSIEIVLGDGQVATADRDPGGQRNDLFWAAASAFGTLGIVTLLELQLRDARGGLVELTHYPVTSFAEASAKTQEECAKPEVDYVDGIAFSDTRIIICSGRLVDGLPSPGQDEGKSKAKAKPVRPRTYLKRRDPWFYLDVEKRTRGGTQQITDYVSLVDYLLRWDRGGFWVARYAFRYFLTPFNRITRAALDRFMHAKVMYHALHKSGLSDQYIIQDIGVPYEAVDEFGTWLDQTFNIYPMWLCPIRLRRDGPHAAHGLHADFADPYKVPEIMLNFGVWGPVGKPKKGSASSDSKDGKGKDYQTFVQHNRDIEAKVHGLGGYKTLYAQNHYTEDEFWAVYPRDAYEAVRARYGASYLPSVYDKIRVDEDAKKRAADASRLPRPLRTVWPVQGLYGVYKAWRGGDYLLQKQKGGKDKTPKVKAEKQKSEKKKTEKSEGQDNSQENQGSKEKSNSSSTAEPEA